MKSPEPSREPGAEPTAGFATVPICLVLALGALCYWGEFYLDRNSGSFDEHIYAPFHTWDEVVANNPVSEEQVQYNLGKLKFHQTCELCHQATGLGQDGKAPPLVGSEWVLAPGPNRIAHAVMNGLTGPITVKGTAWNLTMPAWKDNFTDKEMAAILTYIRSEWGNKAPAVKADLIKKVRAEPHPGPMAGGDELSKLPENL
ncbi:MAG TPA: cytochrome c [Verrucomicrobiae bacterium]|jgi:mono/diheme cytochrome c family protein|nr:cytochrome c [Verrucomicrobiae bacterium]